MKNLMSGYGMRLAHPNGMARACHIPNSTRGLSCKICEKILPDSSQNGASLGLGSILGTKYQRLNLFVAQSSVEAASGSEQQLLT